MRRGKTMGEKELKENRFISEKGQGKEIASQPGKFLCWMKCACVGVWSL